MPSILQITSRIFIASPPFFECSSEPLCISLFKIPNVEERYLPIYLLLEKIIAKGFLCFTFFLLILLKMISNFGHTSDVCFQNWQIAFIISRHHNVLSLLFSTTLFVLPTTAYYTNSKKMGLFIGFSFQSIFKEMHLKCDYDFLNERNMYT